VSSTFTGVNRRMDFEQIREILPHQFPFLMLDRVSHLEPGSRIIALKNVTGNEFHFLGHFPRLAIMPGVLIIEAAAQAAGILWAVSSNREVSSSVDHLLANTNVSFHEAVKPGDQMIIEATVRRSFSQFFIAHVKVSVEKSIVTRGEITLARVAQCRSRASARDVESRDRHHPQR
jgi:3-hydroxyacyl-[acyl-carrier-protein] dehydratase